MESETLEKLKIEIRSILLSSKHGVEAKCIQNDYEQLMYQKLPLKELGFRDVQSLMRAIPDVAEEVRSHTGEITYHAVCDESTAHIQKLVSNQITKKSKSKFSARGRGRRHGVVGRGAYFGRGRWSPDKGGSLGGGAKHRTSRPRALQIMERESENVILASGDYGNYKSEHWGRVKSNEHASATCYNTSRAIFGRGDMESSNSYSNVGTDRYKQSTPVYNLKIGIGESGKREISKLIQPTWKNRGGDEGEPTSQFDLRDFLNRKRAATTLLSEYGEPVCSTVGRHVKTTHGSMDSVINKTVIKLPKSYTYQKFVPPRLQRLQQQKSRDQEKPAVRRVEEPTDLQLYFSGENNGDNWVPPKDGQLYVEAFNNYFAQRGKDAPEVNIIPGKLNKKKGFYSSLSYQDKYYYPLEIMETEELARQNVVRAFCLKNDISLLHNGHTEVNTTPASSRTQQAEVNSNNSASSMKPPEVNSPQASSSTRQAEVNSNNSSLSVKQTEVITTHSTSSMKSTEVNTLQASSSTSQAEVNSNNSASSMKQTEVITTHSTSSMKPTEVNIPQASTSTRQAEVNSNNSASSMKQTEVITAHSSSSTTVSQQKLSDLPETLQKVYKILKANGIWLSNLPNLYNEAYGETFNLDFLSASSQWPQFFTLEHFGGHRYTVYPVANYIPEKTEIAAQSAEKTAAQSTEKIAAMATEKTAAQSAEKTAAQSTEKTAAQATEKIAAQATEKIAAQATEKIAAQSTEKIAAMATEKTAAQSAEKTAAQSAEKTAAQSTEKTAAQATEKIAAQATEKIAAQSTEKIAAMATEKTAAQSAEKTAAQSTEKIAAQATEKIAAQATEKIAAQSTEKIAAQATEKIAAQSTEKTAAQATEKIAAQATEKIAAQSTEKTAAQATEKIAAQSTEKIAAQATEKIAAQSTEKIAAQSTEKIAAQATEKTAAQATEKIAVQVPPSLQLAVGSKLQMFFSFAYSAEDVYLQRADMENLVYDIDDVLNNNCPASSAPEVDTIVLKSLVAASYENRWYRAQVVAIQKLTVKVYFIDYGNLEEVSFADLRPIPQESLILNTPSLAIKCALRKTKAGEWLKDVFSVLSDLSETYSVLSAVIVEHKGEQCIVDLHTPEGGLVNDMLLQSVPSPTTRVEEVHSITNSPEPGVQQLGRNPSLSAAAPRLFADDPEPLVLPDSEAFAVYVCRVMSENTVLLRIVDDEYSEKLDELEQGIADNFYSWPIPEKIRQSNIYACMVLAGAEDAEDVEYDEEGKEKISDQNSYHRVRVLKEHKGGACDCYLPDHGHNETLNRSQLREIDSQLNVALSYQAFMVRLHGLDNLPDKLKPMAVRLLIKLLTNGATFYAVKKGKSAEKRKDDPGGVGVNITERVRKIISCLKDIQPSVVAKLYEQVYKEPVDNVEEIIKNIPGYGFWKESLEVVLVDTSQEDSDVIINEYVLATIDEMEKVESGGGSVEDVWRDLFCSDTDSGSQQGELDNWEGNERLQDDKNLVDAGVSKAETDTQPDLVREPVQALAAEADGSVTPASGKSLYTWKTKPASPGAAAASSPTSATSQGALPANPACDNSQLPKFWQYPLLKFVSVQIVRVENPSDFVAIPMEQRGALEKLEMAIAQYFSANKAEATVTCSDNVLYSVKSKDVYRRAQYVSLIGDMVKVFFPDHYSYDLVPPSELLPLPVQFHSLPFLARKMRLGGILPQGQDWPAHVSQWFKTTVGNKSLYALVTGQDSNMNQNIPWTLVVRLIDTSGSEDLVVDEYMVSQEMAVSEPSGD
ncbi:hypothetical protein BsWGS_24115 [Bradybaena similaris]